MVKLIFGALLGACIAWFYMSDSPRVAAAEASMSIHTAICSVGQIAVCK